MFRSSRRLVRICPLLGEGESRDERRTSGGAGGEAEESALLAGEEGRTLSDEASGRCDSTGEHGELLYAVQIIGKEGRERGESDAERTMTQLDRPRAESKESCRSGEWFRRTR